MALEMLEEAREAELSAQWGKRKAGASEGGVLF